MDKTKVLNEFKEADIVSIESGFLKSIGLSLESILVMKKTAEISPTLAQEKNTKKLVYFGYNRTQLGSKGKNQS